ncbi:MAG TPA: hypothetical protein DEA43_02580 [Candidatus Moranbacteria bacterium]|nr:hypothetical protein [Candidatus Moranbacteria bacterium]HBT45749.1 hypothetical protein [Candidatus Moranbacteria bacterium]
MTDVIFESSLEIKAAQASNIPQIVGDWWKEISKQSNSPATPGKLYAVGNYLVQLVKNSLSDGKSNGKVTAIFDEEKIKIVIDDLGSEEKDINLNVKGEYGMKEAIEYFDVFNIESKGKLYEKDNRNMIEEVDESDVYAGSKVTIIKYHITPVEEAEETWQSSRNFGQRM